MTRTSFVIAIVGAVVALGAPAAGAQDVTATQGGQTAPPVQSPQIETMPARPQPPAGVPGQVQITPQKLERIFHIRQLESLLTNAVRAGATTFASQLQVEPSTLFVTGNVRARGHELEDYGVFFDVDVPTILPSALWAFQMRQQQVDDLNTLRNAIADPKTSESIRRVAQLEARKLERVLGLPSAPPAAPRGVAMATTVVDDAAVVPPPVTVTPVPQLDARDPLDLYTEAIKSKLIDTMLSYGSALGMADNEWLTIAARSSDVPPGQLDDSASVLLRIRGADLNALMLKKITREEAIKKIEIKIG